MTDRLDVKVISPSVGGEQDLEAASALLNVVDGGGQMQVLPGHEMSLVLLEDGKEVVLQDEDGEVLTALGVIGFGSAEVKNNVLTVIAEALS